MNYHVRCRFFPVVAVWVLAPAPLAFASVDAPGSLAFNWLADEEVVYREYPDLPPDAAYFEANAFFSSDASGFGSEGVFVWGGFDLLGPDGPRYGMILMDLDLTQAPVDGVTPMPASAVRAEYLEKRADEILFEGVAILGEVWIVDVIFHNDDKGAVQGKFAMVFADPQGEYPGSRVFLQGEFVTHPTPTSVRRAYGIVDQGPDGQTYVDVGCSGDVYVADDTGEGCGCGGEDPDSGGCEGDTSGGGGCEGDSGSGSAGGGCEGDSGGCGSGGGDCSSGGGGACSQKAHASVGMAGGRGAPLRGLMHLFPEISVLWFIGRLRRSYRRL